MNNDAKNCLIIAVAALVVALLLVCCGTLLFAAVGMGGNAPARPVTGSVAVDPAQPCTDGYLTFASSLTQFPEGGFQLAGENTAFPPDSQVCVVFQSRSGATLPPGPAYFRAYRQTETGEVLAWEETLKLEEWWTYSYYPISGLETGRYRVEVVGSDSGDTYAQATLLITE